MEQNTIPKAAEEAKKAGHTVLKLTADDSGLDIYLRKPTKAEVLLFQDGLAKPGASPAAAQEKFVRQLYVGDTPAEFDAYLNANPFAVGGLFGAVAGEMGLKANFTPAAI